MKYSEAWEELKKFVEERTDFDASLMSMGEMMNASASSNMAKEVLCYMNILEEEYE